LVEVDITSVWQDSLTGYEIDVFREGAEEDVELSEFSDEIDRLDY
jgi:hypothetical protein